MILYVSQHCAGCQTVLAHTRSILNRFDVKWVDRDDAANYELQRRGGRMMPALFDPSSRRENQLYSGASEVIARLQELRMI